MQPSQLKFFFVFVLTVNLFAQQSVPVKLDDKLPIDPKVKIGKLENGLTYYIRENKKPENRAELRLVVNAGSVLEDDNQNGLAHFVEHMGFNGTKNFKKHELIDFLESIGMQFGPEVNAFTSFDETVYMLQVPTDTANYFEKGMEVLSEWAHNVSFENEEIDKERGVIIEEWRLGRGAQARMRDQQFPILFKNSKYAERMVIGTKEILESFDYETLKKFYKDWYRSDLMAVVAVGDFKTADVEKLISKYFAEIKEPENPRERILSQIPDHKETLYAIASDKEATYSLVQLVMKTKKDSEKIIADYRKSIVENLFSSMLNKRLYELTKLADPPFIGASGGKTNLVKTKDAYYIAARVKDNGIDKGLDAILKEAERVKQFGFTSTELEREKTESIRWMENAFAEKDKTESNNLIWSYVNNYLEDEPIMGIENEYGIQKQLLPGITLEEINTLASNLITSENRVVMVNSPQKEGVKIPSEQELSEVIQNASNEKLTAYEDKVSSEDLIPAIPQPAQIINETKNNDLGTTELKLANGIKVILKPTDFKNDEIIFNSFSPGGLSLVEDSKYYSGANATSIADESGLGKFNEIELQKMLSGKIVSTNPWIDGLYEGISGSSSPQDVETMFKLIYAYFTEPRFDTTAYSSYLTKMKTYLENRNLSPEAAFSDTITVTTSNYHFRAKPWSTELLKDIELNEASEVYKNRFADAGDFTFFFVGNFEIEKIKPLIATYLGGLPNLKRNENWKDMGIRTPKGVITKEIRKGIEPKSRVYLTYNGPFEWNTNNVYNLSALSDVMNIKLREVIREDKGGSYGVGVWSSPEHYPVPEYNISISFGCDPKRVDELTGAVMQQIDSMKNFGPTDIYITKVKEQDLRTREVDLKTNSFWLDALRNAYMDNTDPKNILDYPKRVNALTKDDVKTAAQKYFDMNNYIKIVLYPQANQ